MVNAPGDVVVHASVSRCPPTHAPLTQVGHGVRSFDGRMKVCERSGRVTCAAPVVAVSEPLASVPIVFTTQVESPPFSMGRGGPKRQFGLSTHDLRQPYCPRR